MSLIILRSRPNEVNEPVPCTYHYDVFKWQIAEFNMRDAWAKDRRGELFIVTYL